MSHEPFDDTKKLDMALARIGELERTVDLLESNARVQAKLLADTGSRGYAPKWRDPMKSIDIVDAWYSVTDEWFFRRNKAHNTQQWEIVHASEDTMKVVGRREHHEAAEAEARRLEDRARGEAVLALINRSPQESASE